MFRKSLRHILNLSLSTLASRLLGLLRDVVMMSALGTGIFSSAFLLAFTVPNLFRRLLGEGALSSAFTPVFTGLVQNKRIRDAWQTANQTLTYLAIVTGAIILIGVLSMEGALRAGWLGSDWEVAVPFFQWLLPYTLLICMAAILTAALNSLGKFLIASFSPILLNIAMIGAIVLGGFVWKQEPRALAFTLCGGVLAGGCLQLLLPALQALASGWKPAIDTSHTPHLLEVKTLFLTATVGAAVIQLNTLISRILAYKVSEDAVAQLYLASRMTELPLGMFSVAIYTVLFPLLARHSAANDRQAFSETFENGTILTLIITLPAMFGLAVLAEPIISLLFVWGRFEADQVAQIGPLLAIHAIGIPFYSLIALTIRGFHASKDMKSPVRIAVYSLFFNTALSVALMYPFGVIGLASANTITAILQTLFLFGSFRRHHFSIPIGSVLAQTARILAISAVMGGTCWILRLWWLPNPGNASKVTLAVATSGIILSGVAIYAALVWASGLKTSILRWLKK